MKKQEKGQKKIGNSLRNEYSGGRIFPFIVTEGKVSEHF